SISVIIVFFLLFLLFVKSSSISSLLSYLSACLFSTHFSIIASRLSGILSSIIPGGLFSSENCLIVRVPVVLPLNGVFPVTFSTILFLNENNQFFCPVYQLLHYPGESN